MSIVLVLILFFLPLQVNAQSTSLTDFQVENGTLLYPFSTANNVYTIQLESDADLVQFTYQLEDETSNVEVIDNTFEEQKENVMLLKITNEAKNEEEIYTFYLEKEEAVSTIHLDDATSSLNISKKERSPFLAPSIIVSCLLIIGILFYFLIIRFWKKSFKKKSST